MLKFFLLKCQMDSVLKKKKSIQEIQIHPQGTANKSKNLKPQKQPRINYFAQPPFFFSFTPITTEQRKGLEGEGEEQDLHI